MQFMKNTSKEKQAASQQQIKEANLNLIFNLINRHEAISRADMVKIAKLSPTTVSSLADELLKSGMILETGAGTSKTSGRKPIMLEVNRNGGFVASVEMMEDSYRCFIYNLKCKVIGGGKYKVGDYNSVGQQIINRIDKTLANNLIDKSKLLGICIGIPGIIDYDSNHVLSSTVVSIDSSNDFYHDIKKYYGNIPVLIENESCFCAYAEKEFGSLNNVRNLIFIDINVGIGAGIILNGQIFTGSFGVAGEIGHMSIDINGPKCKCGNRGCLEVMASIPAILQKSVFAMMSGRETVIKTLVNDDYNKVNIGIIVKALKMQDILANEIIDETVARLASGINNAINLFSPEVVIIGGELKELGESFLDKLRKCICNIGLKPNINKVIIKYSVLNKDVVTLGGAKYSLDSLFKRWYRE